MNPLRSCRDSGCLRSIACVVAVAVLVAGCGGASGRRGGVRPTTTVGPTTTVTGTTTPELSPSSTAVGPAPSPSVPVVVPAGERITAVGDSVMLDAAPDLESDIPGIVVDAAVSRQWSDGEVVLEELKAADQVGTR